MQDQQKEHCCPHCQYRFSVSASKEPSVRFCPSCGKLMLGAPPIEFAEPSTLIGPNPAKKGSSPAGSLNPHETADIAPALDKTPSERRGHSPGPATVLRETPATDDRFTAGPVGKMLKPGTVIAGCRIVRIIGRGAMGQVYEVEYLGDDKAQPRKQALKILVPETAKNPMYVELFQTEGRLSLQCVHPNLVRTYDAGFCDQILYQRMQLVGGKDLRSRIKKGHGMPPDDAARIVLQVARGLAYAHIRGFVHRDIKPENILVDVSGGEPLYLVSDLGLIKELGEREADQALTPADMEKACRVIAKELDRHMMEGVGVVEAHRFVNELLSAIDLQALSAFRFRPLHDIHTAYAEFRNIDAHLTTSMGIHNSECMGTPIYMSPEQIERRVTDGRSDIYALGILFYELIAGQAPFSGRNVEELFQSKLRDLPPPIDIYVDPAYQARVEPYEDIIGCMLMRERRCRYRKMRHVMMDIDRVLTLNEEPWCSNARFLYEDAIEQQAATVASSVNASADEVVTILTNLIDAVFEMSKGRNVPLDAAKLLSYRIPDERLADESEISWFSKADSDHITQHAAGLLESIQAVRASSSLNLQVESPRPTSNVEGAKSNLSVAVLRVQGDAASMDEFTRLDAKLGLLVEAGYRRIVLDLSGLTHAEPEFWGFVLSWFGRRSELGVNYAFVCQSTPIRAKLKQLGLGAVGVLCETVDEARKATRPERNSQRNAAGTAGG